MLHPVHSRNKIELQSHKIIIHKTHIHAFINKKKKSKEETQGKHFKLFLILNVHNNAQVAEINSIVSGSVRIGKFRNNSFLNWGIQCHTSK